MLPIVIKILSAVHVLVSLFIILLVLMQRPKNEGLGAAFGGGMTENLFGAQTSNVLQTITRWLGGIFFALSLTLSFLYVKDKHKSNIQQQLLGAPAAPAAPAASDQDKLRDAILKAVQDQKGDAVPADAKPVLPEAASPPVKPGEPLPAAPDAKPAAPNPPDAKPDAPAPAAEKPAPPEKPADEAPK
jgi:preprotein translocase subunit SecG